MKKITFIASLALSMFFITCSKDSKTEKKDDCIETNTFAEIKPIIDKNCGTAGCHAVNSGNGGLTTFQDVKNIWTLNRINRLSYRPRLQTLEHYCITHRE